MTPPSADPTPSDAADRGLDLRRIFTLARPELTALGLGTVALLVSSGANLAAPWVVGQLVDGVVGEGGEQVLNQMTLLLVGVFVVAGLATAARSYLFTTAGERVVARLRQDLYAAVIHQEVGFFDARRTGELTNRLASDTTVLQNTVTVNVSMGLRLGIQALGAIGVLLFTNWRLTLVMLTVVPLVAASAGVYGRLLRKVSTQVQDALARSSEVAEETLAGLRTVRAFARERQEVARYGEAVDESFRLARYRARLGATFVGAVSILGYGAIAGVLWYGGRLLFEGQMSFGELTSFLLYTFTVAFAVGGLSGLYSDFAKAVGASRRVFELMDREPAVASSGSTVLETVRGEVRLEDVHFAYPTRPDSPVLQGLDLRLDPGEVVALVGPSGGGKSTVAALLSRFYDPQRGGLHLDGEPFEDLDPDWLRQQVGVVSQEPILFATSVTDNIRYGRLDATPAEVEEAARAANAHEFVSAFAEGYDTPVGERGVRLSGGQKQRIAIARALLKDPRVLVLDEATSALDAESEHLVQEALDRLMKGRTTLVIAHRLSTVKGADRVVVLDQGRVAQAGTHDDLVATDGLYRRLVERQFAAG